jgi:DNA-directed RNA polymerase specialized sigma24 family protein
MPKDLTSVSFAKLLKALSSDEAESARLYTKLHESLVNYFALKGISAPDRAADETIDRIPERITQNTKTEDIRFIAFSVAKFVFLEKIRQEQKRLRADEGFYQKTGAVNNFAEKDEFEPLRACFKSLFEHERKLLVGYFADLAADELSEHRQNLADREGIDLNALRNRVSRLRKRLEECLGRAK